MNLDSTKLAPIALFVYNRPDHALKTLSNLKECNYASESSLFIFSDGPKNPDDPVQGEKIRKMREVIRSEKWCREVNYIESSVNRGLANSLIRGITDITNQYGKVIVVEDDLQLSLNFLKYMNEGLQLYENEPRVMSINAYIPKLKGNLPETYFLHIPTWWGWATWKRAWDSFNPSAEDLMVKVKEKGKLAFDFNRSINWYRLLRRNFEGKVDSWAIRWYASVYVQNGYCLHPRQALVNNAGCDESGVHSYNSSFMDTIIAENITVEPVPIVYCNKARKALTRFNWMMKFNDLPHYIKKRIRGEYNIKKK
jgi:hypothetical protein